MVAVLKTTGTCRGLGAAGIGVRPLLKWKGDPKKVIGLHRCDAIFGNPFWSRADPLPKWKGDPKKVIVVDLR